MTNKKSVNFLLAIVAVFAVMGVMSFTGNMVSAQDTSEGNVTLTIESATEINFTTDSLDFGSGAVDPGATNATIDSEGTVTDGTWGPTNGNLTLENIGTEDVALNLSTDTEASALIGGSSPSFKWKVDESESTSCGGSTEITDYTEASTAEQEACANFDATDANDEVGLNFELVIPSDATQAGEGTQTAVITATGTSA